MQKVEIPKCLRAMANVMVTGAISPVTGRGYSAGDRRTKAIEDAIAAIQADGKTALTGGYIGIKNYAGFGDQREDHEYGMGPRHGSIVFRISRTEDARKNEVELGPEEIYLLECVRDFGETEDPFRTDGRFPKTLNLCGVLAAYAEARTRQLKFKEILEGAGVEASA